MADLLAVHRRELEAWRRVMNLVGPGPVDEHYIDAEGAVGWLRPAGHWADLGTGAGFPGVVLAHLHPELRVDLVDSRRKRCVFLEHVLAAADVDRDRVRVMCQRVEALPSGAYDGVTARAFAPPPAVFQHAERLLRPGGSVVLFLQGGAAVPSSEVFDEVGRQRYVVQGRERLAVELTKIGA